MFLLSLAIAWVDPTALVAGARDRLRVLAASDTSHRFRVDGSPAQREVTAKDRAFAERGEKCAVVGARRCPKRARPLVYAQIAPPSR